MRHVVAGAVLVLIALVVTFGVATMLQDMASSRARQADQYVPPAFQSPGGKPKPGENARVFMMSRRINDDRE